MEECVKMRYKGGYHFREILFLSKGGFSRFIQPHNHTHTRLVVVALQLFTKQLPRYLSGISECDSFFREFSGITSALAVAAAADMEPFAEVSIRSGRFLPSIPPLQPLSLAAQTWGCCCTHMPHFLLSNFLF